jgi:STE24 endopeptidase
VTLRRRIGLPAAIVGALLVAEAAVWLLRPDRVISPAEVPESRFFSPAQLDRARDFAGPQRLLAIGGLALEGALLVVLVVRPPRRVLLATERAARGRPLVAGALLGAGLALALRLAPLPVDAIARQRALDVGLATQGWGDWALDSSKAAAIGTALAAAGAALFLGLMRRSPRRWWLWGATAVVAIEVVFVWLAPVLLAPLFNRFQELPPGRTRSDVIALAREAGVDVGDVLVVDASRRTSGANAYVTGIGHTKRVVLYDTLLERFTPAEVRLVVAHELGHVKNRDVPRGMLWVALVAPAGMYVVKRLTERWTARTGTVPGAPASLPAFVLALALVAFGATIVSNQLSRRVEARADAYALDLTAEGRQFVAMEHRLTLSNVADPDPPRAFVWLFGTHPAPIDRIGAGIAFERERVPASRPLPASRPSR